MGFRGRIWLLVLVWVMSVAALLRADAPARVIVLEGTAQQIGAAHAEALADPIRDLHENYLMAYLKGPAERFLAMRTAGLFEAHLSADHLAEARALAEGTRLDLPTTLLAQGFLDLLPIIACSTIALPADASADGVARFGRNLDFPSLGVADRHSVVLVYRPEGRYGFAVVGWPGMLGVLSGMNEHGLALSNMEVRRLPRLPQAMPYTLLYRTVLEQCRTVDEAVELLSRTPRQTANNLMLMDADGNRAVVEITPESVVVRRGEAGQPLISTNHQRGQDIASAGRCRRYDHLWNTSAAEFGQIGQGTVEQMLKDVSQGNMTLQSMIFEPSTRTLHLATGLRAHEKTFHRIALDEYFPR
jgi:isopenicillin-N N-acyltransferase like protein